MAKSLSEIREEIAAKSKRLHDIFEQAGEDMDMSKVALLEGDSHAKAAEIKRLNTELSELGKERDGLAELEQTRVQVKGVYDDHHKPAKPMVFPGGNGQGASAPVVQAKSFGDLFVESAAFREYSAASKRSPVVEVDAQALFERKALLDTTGWAPESMRTGRIVEGALRRPVVADLIPQGTTNSNAIVFMEETTTTNAGAAVAEGAAKPESTLAFTERTAPVRKIATVLPVTDELMADEPAMRAYVEGRLRIFLQLAEETQLVSGSGVAPNLTGMLNVTGIQTQAKGTDPTPDAVYKAMVKVQTVAFLEPSGAIFHPNDWQDVRLLRTADGVYIWGSPADPGPERIWGLPVVSTTAATENTAVVAAFDTAMQIFRRAEVAFAVSDQHSDFFTTNKLMLRVEERLAFPVYRPTGICTVTGI